MSYSSGSAGARSPEEKLADRGWRLRSSWWIFPPVLSLGFLGWLGFMAAAVKTGEKLYWYFCALYAGLSVTFVVIAGMGVDGPLFGLAFVPFLGSWLAPTIHAALLNHRYLRTLANRGSWYAPPVAASTDARPQPQPQPQQVLGVSAGDYYGAVPAPSEQPAQPPRPIDGPIDVRTATVDDLAARPGVDRALATRVVAVRDARGGYRDLDDLASAANLQPHEVVRLRSHLTFGGTEAPQPARPKPGTGRILDI